MNNVNRMSFSGSFKWALFWYWFLSSPDHCISCLRSPASCHESISSSLVCPVHFELRSISGSIKTSLASIFITLKLRIAQYCVCVLCAKHLHFCSKQSLPYRSTNHTLKLVLKFLEENQHNLKYPEVDV